MAYGATAAMNTKEVSINATGDHVTTASEWAPGLCSYGLTVGSASDPIVAADGLSGSGVFANLVDPATSCAANTAPISGWVKVSKTDLHDAGVPVPSEG